MLKFFLMENKVVVITGGSSGIGLSCAEEFGKHGNRIVIAARNAETLAHASEQLKKNNIEHITVQADVSKEDDCKNIIEKCIEKYGQIDILINNAGMSMRALFEDVDLKVLKQLMDINFWGTVYCTKYALPHLLKSHGSVIGISSVAGKKGVPARTGYSASKFAMEGFLETLRIETLKRNLHVLVVNPGFVATNIRYTSLTKDGSAQVDSPRDESKMMQPEEVAQEIYKATQKRKRDLVLTSQGKLVVFLNKFFPGFMDKMVYNHMAKEANAPIK